MRCQYYNHVGMKNYRREYEEYHEGYDYGAHTHEGCNFGVDGRNDCDERWRYLRSMNAFYGNGSHRDESMAERRLIDSGDIVGRERDRKNDHFTFLNSLGTYRGTRYFIEFNSISCAIPSVPDYDFNIATYVSCVESSPTCLNHNINKRKETYHGVRRPRQKYWRKTNLILWRFDKEFFFKPISLLPCVFLQRVTFTVLYLSMPPLLMLPASCGYLKKWIQGRTLQRRGRLYDLGCTINRRAIARSGHKSHG
ncbi:hypothetical protein M9H77_31207 [Catharanthus roseus]|uniref:Uncharacterized protein n=1 Tax=Catharanthus roseus TaxID=4058 RepID=A0ACC0A190_CATRO|nr:hypothetical protein M9H77_31207 [Catharanthus roseus]